MHGLFILFDAQITIEMRWALAEVGFLEEEGEEQVCRPLLPQLPFSDVSV